MNALVGDVRYACRRLRNDPGFTAVAVLTLALGVGATTAVFGIVNELLFKPRAVSQPDELAAVGFRDDDGALARPDMSRPFYEIFRAEPRTFSDLIGFARVSLELQQSDIAVPVAGELVSGSYFQTLGVRPALGRVLDPSDDERLGEGCVAVISHRLWQRQFQADPNAIGRRITLMGQPFDIVGVAPEKFIGLHSWSVDLWLPTTTEPLFNEDTAYHLVGRLAPGISRVQAQADLQRVSQYLSKLYGRNAPPGYEQYRGIERYGRWSEGRQVALLSAGRGSVAPFYSTQHIWRAFYLFVSAAGVVLLIACSNFANLLLVKVLRNRKEIATRLALGASPGRVIRQSLTESLLLASLGAMVGVVLALWLSRLLNLWKPAHVRFMAEISLDWRVLSFSVLCALGTGGLFGLLPAFRSGRFDVFSVLKSDTALPGRRRRMSLKHWLVSGQLALCLTLLVGAGLCLRSFARLLGVDPGYDTRRTVVASLNLEEAGYTADRAPSVLSETVERLEALPGIVSVAFSQGHPLSGLSSTVRLDSLDGYIPKEGEQIEFNEVRVEPAFFRTMGMRMALGAQRRHIIGLVLRQGLIVTAYGMGIGLVGAVAVAWMIRGMLFNTGPLDLVTFGGIVALLATVSLLACWIPARRAAKIDPMKALRYE